MSRSKYVSVGNTGGLILDSKYDDFATNAKLEELKVKIESLRSELTRHNNGSRNVKKPTTQLYVEQLLTDYAPSYGVKSYHQGNHYVISHGFLERTEDNWATKSRGINVVNTEAGNITKAVVWADGTVCGLTTTGNVVRMDDFNSEPQITLETETSFTSPYGSSFYSDGLNNYVLAGQYTEGVAPKHLYLSKDGGDTFEIIKTTQGLGTTNSHWHAAEFDPYSGAIWASEGDGPNSSVWVTYDLGETWELVSEEIQPTLIIPLPDRVLFGRDGGSSPGFDCWERKEQRFEHPAIYPIQTNMEFRTDLSPYDYVPTNEQVVVVDRNIAYVGYHKTDGNINYIFATGDGGASWHLVSTSKMKILGATSTHLMCAVYNPTGLALVPLLEWV